ncbi:MAG TPA: DUF3549 family protein [Gammaproteobacteria bacterium]|nr:DUF3549 family protein [Gammaproteobacteria bacterium]MCP5433935.1 DUF3549 family protein [Chromatiaceae bacterium]HPQ26308.1 DUF3549 family protein [Gammaproteobacteria bacterium]
MLLTEFLEQTGAKVVAYDIGRRVGAIERADFLAFEQAIRPYPLPMQRKAWFALVQITGDDPQNPLIWFLRLSLDEQGLLVQAERDYLFERLLESAQAHSRGADPQAFLQDNPYAFTPRDDRMALFHALLSADLGLAPSRHYAHALEYFRGALGWDQWGFVGYQGIADVASRHGGEPLPEAIPVLPGEPLVALCHCLESRPVQASLAEALQARLRQALSTGQADMAIVAALIRGLSGSVDRASQVVALKTVLAHPIGSNIEILAAIAGRAWESLGDDALLHTYLQRLAHNDHGQPAFEHCVRDLLSLPALADQVRGTLRSAGQTNEVREAFTRMTAGQGRNEGPGT